MTPAPSPTLAAGRFRVVMSALVILAALRVAVAVLGHPAARGDFYATLPGAYAETLNPTLWNSPDLSESWGFHRQTYFHGPTQYLTLFPIVFLDSYASIGRVLLVLYLGATLLACEVMSWLFGFIANDRRPRALVYAATLLYFPLIQALAQREFEIVMVLALALAYTAVVRNRPWAFGGFLAYIAWFKYAPLLALPYLALRRWWSAVAGFLVLSAVLLGAAQWLFGLDRKSTRLNSSHSDRSRMPSSA